jgi:hypothetical protein
MQRPTTAMPQALAIAYHLLGYPPPSCLPVALPAAVIARLGLPIDEILWLRRLADRRRLLAAPYLDALDAALVAVVEAHARGGRGDLASLLLADGADEADSNFAAVPTVLWTLHRLSPHFAVLKRLCKALASSDTYVFKLTEASRMNVQLRAACVLALEPHVHAVDGVLAGLLDVDADLSVYMDADTREDLGAACSAARALVSQYGLAPVPSAQEQDVAANILAQAQSTREFEANLKEFAARARARNEARLARAMIHDRDLVGLLARARSVYLDPRQALPGQAFAGALQSLLPGSLERYSRARASLCRLEAVYERALHTQWQGLKSKQSVQLCLCAREQVHVLAFLRRLAQQGIDRALEELTRLLDGAVASPRQLASVHQHFLDCVDRACFMEDVHGMAKALERLLKSVDAFAELAAARDGEADARAAANARVRECVRYLCRAARPRLGGDPGLDWDYFLQPAQPQLLHAQSPLPELRW